MTQLLRFVEMNVAVLLVLAAITLVLYVAARILSARWPVALTFSALPAIVFFFFTPVMAAQ